MARTNTSLTRGEKLLLFWIGLFVAVVVGSTWWWTDLNATPSIAIPTPAMPVPNARDAFITGANALKSSTIIEEAYKAQIDPLKPAPPPGAVRAAIAANTASIAWLHTGFERDYREIPWRSSNQLGPYISKYRTMVHMLYVDANDQTAHRDWDGALNVGLDGIHFCILIPKGGPLFWGVFGANNERTTRAQVWRVIPHLTAKAARDGARRLESSLMKRVAFSEMLEDQKWYMLAALIERFSEPTWRKDILFPKAQIMRESEDPPKLPFLLVRERTVTDNVARYMDAIIADSRLPYALRHAPPPMPTDPFSPLVLPDYAIYSCFHTTNETQAALLLVSLALRAYYVEHKRYPATLTALAPGYLTALPDDPYAVSGTFQYKLKKTGYLLYSLGPDNVDNGGTPCKDGQRFASTGTGPLKPTSTGDIVAGINVQ